MKKWVVLLLLLFLVGCVTPKEENRIIEYEVKYVSNTDEEFDTIKVKKGISLDGTHLPVPQDIEGYVFDGWYIESDFLLSAIDFVVNADLCLYGKWSEVLPTAEELALATIELVSSTYEDIDLPQTVDGFVVEWVSSNPDALSNKGKVKRLAESTTVEMNAYIVTDDVYVKTLYVIVEKYPYEAKFEEVFSLIQFPDKIDKSITLNTRFLELIRGTWSSNKSTIISPNGVVSLTKNEEEVALTLTLELDGVGASKTFIVYTKPRGLNYKDPEYFVEQLSKRGFDVNETIMDLNEINSFNQAVLDTPAANTISLADHPLQISGSEINKKILNYSNIDRYPVYNYQSLKVLSQADKNTILANRNLNVIASAVEMKYAVSITHTVMRSYPTHHYSSTNAMDRFQETGYSIGVPMIVYHTSLDGAWYFVRMFHYEGWVPADSVGLCNREEFLDYVSPQQFIVVLNNFVKIEGEVLRMGYKIPYADQNADSYRLKFPTRNSEGQMVIKDVMLEKSNEVSDGYIPYTYSNLLTQGYKFVGTAYSWGDKFVDGLDCSSTQAAIYACFGFVLGRNTSNQRVTKTYASSVSNLTNEKLKTYPVGTLLYTDSHVLMYIGYDEHGSAWLLHNTNSGNICKLETLASYGTSGIKWTFEFTLK